MKKVTLLILIMFCAVTFAQRQANSVNSTRSLEGPASFTSSSNTESKTTNEPPGSATLALGNSSQNRVPVTITHSNSQAILALNSVTCNTGGIPTQNMFYRDFNLANDFGIAGDFNVTNAEFGVEEVSGPVNLTINIYSTAGPFPTGFPGSLTLQGSAAYVSNVADALTVVSVPVTATIPAGQIMIYELRINAGAVNSFFPGSNDAGQTGVSWIAAADCGITNPTNLAAIGFPNQHSVMNIVGEEGGGGSCNLIASTPDDALGVDTWVRPFADGTCCSGLGPVSYHIYGPFTVDVAGAYTIDSEQMGWDGYLFLYQNSFDPLNQTVNYVAGNDDFGGVGFSQIISALAVGTDYFIITTGFAAGDFGDFENTITGPGTVTCGGGGGGTCISETYAATGLPSDIDPGGTSTANCAAAPNLYPVTVPDAGIIGTDTVLENVTINITHTWSGDLEIYLRSPSGVELMLWDNVGGSGDNFTNTQFQDGGIPSAGSTAPHTGIYAPVGGTFAAAFAGEDINGDWQLKICDTAGGDTGTLDSFSITFCIEDPGTTNNWECADAIALNCGDVVTGSTTGASNSGGNTAGDVFYSYTGNGDLELVTISLCGGGTTYDSWLRVFSNCTLTNEIASNDDFCGLQSQLTFESDGISTYIIMVEGFSSSEGNFSLEITCALPPGCGDTFTDSGGPAGNYANNEDTTWTFFPDNVDDYVIVTFTVFNVESGWDALYVFDGPDTSSPLISSGNPPTGTNFPAGGYYGTTIPGPFSSTHPSGALTFRFMSDGSVTRPGWVADITCLPVPPPNDLIVNAIDVDQFPQAYTDTSVRLQYATNELLNPQDCAIAGTNGVWYKFTATASGTAEASVTTPSGTTAVIFYAAPNENVTNETDLVYNFESNNQCAPGTQASITTTAGQSYYIYVLNTGGESDVVIDISNSLGIDENVIDGFTFYPNPMDNLLNMRANNVIENIVIYNMLGQKVINQNIGATSSTLDVSSLSTGAYIMKVTAEGQSASYQLIKK